MPLGSSATVIFYVAARTLPTVVVAYDRKSFMASTTEVMNSQAKLSNSVASL